MLIREILLPEFETETANTRKLLELVPEDRMDYLPHQKSMTLGRLASHVAELPKWATMTLATDGLDMQPGQAPFIAKSRAELLETLDKCVAEAKEAIAGASDERMLGTWTLTFAGKLVFSNARYIVVRDAVINHLVHHRAQLGVYLRLNEVEIPGMYGPSADEMKFWSAGQTA